jgi:hypothetical protein
LFISFAKRFEVGGRRPKDNRSMSANYLSDQYRQRTTEDPDFKTPPSRKASLKDCPILTTK